MSGTLDSTISEYWALQDVFIRAHPCYCQQKQPREETEEKATAEEAGLMKEQL